MKNDFADFTIELQLSDLTKTRAELIIFIDKNPCSEVLLGGKKQKIVVMAINDILQIPITVINTPDIYRRDIQVFDRGTPRIRKIKRIIYE